MIFFLVQYSTNRENSPQMIWNIDHQDSQYFPNKNMSYSAYNEKLNIDFHKV